MNKSQTIASEKIKQFILELDVVFDIKLLDYCSESQIEEFILLDEKNRFINLISQQIEDVFPKLGLYFIIKGLNKIYKKNSKDKDLGLFIKKLEEVLNENEGLEIETRYSVEKSLRNEFEILKAEFYKREEKNRENNISKQEILKRLTNIGFFSDINVQIVLEKILRKQDSFSEREVVARLVRLLKEEREVIEIYSEKNLLEIHENDLDNYCFEIKNILDNVVHFSPVILKELLARAIDNDKLNLFIQFSEMDKNELYKSFCIRYINIEKLFEKLKKVFDLNGAVNDRTSPRLFSMFAWIYFNVLNLKSEDFNYSPFKNKKLYSAFNREYSLKLIDCMVDYFLKNDDINMIMQKVDFNGYFELFDLYLKRNLSLRNVYNKENFQILDLFFHKEEENLITLVKFFNITEKISETSNLLKFADMLEKNDEIYFDVFSEDVLGFISEVNNNVKEKIEVDIDFENKEHKDLIVEEAKKLSEEQYTIKTENEKLSKLNESLNHDERLIILGNRSAVKIYCEKLKIIGLTFNERFNVKKFNNERRSAIILEVILYQPKKVKQLFEKTDLVINLTEKKLKNKILRNEIFKHGFFNEIGDINVKFNLKLSDFLDIVSGLSCQFHNNETVSAFSYYLLSNKVNDFEDFSYLIERNKEYFTEINLRIIKKHIYL